MPFSSQLYVAPFGWSLCSTKSRSNQTVLVLYRPLSLDIVQLPRLNQFRQFLMLDRGDMRRIVYEMRPESLGEKAGYEEFRRYLAQGREGERAGLALELDRAGYKVFVLPPGPAARALGYNSDFLIAVIRRRG